MGKKGTTAASFGTKKRTTGINTAWKRAMNLVSEDRRRKGLARVDLYENVPLLKKRTDASRDNVLKGVRPKHFMEMLDQISDYFSRVEPAHEKSSYLSRYHAALKEDAAVIDGSLQRPVVSKVNASNAGYRSYDKRVLSALVANEDAAAFLKAHRGTHEEVIPFGASFELRSWLFPDKGFTENGLSWSDITITRHASNRPFEFDRKLIDDTVIKRLEGSWNGPKFSLVGLLPPHDVAEEGRWAHFDTAWTDYLTVQACQSTVIPNRRLRHGYMDLDPSKHGIPNTFNLNFIVRFADKVYWLIRRSTTVRHENGRVSFSGEEQLKSEDFNHKNPLKAWTVRTLMEEVYPFRDFPLDSAEAGEVRGRIVAARYLSLFLEEKYGTFGLIAFIQLGIESERFVYHYYREQLESTRRADNEGVRYFIDEAELLRFMHMGECTARRVLDDESTLRITIDESERDAPHDGCAHLHHTALYRMHKTCELLGVIPSQL